MTFLLYGNNSCSMFTFLSNSQMLIYLLPPRLLRFFLIGILGSFSMTLIPVCSGEAFAPLRPALSFSAPRPKSPKRRNLFSSFTFRPTPPSHARHHAPLAPAFFSPSLDSASACRFFLRECPRQITLPLSSYAARPFGPMPLRDSFQFTTFEGRRNPNYDSFSCTCRVLSEALQRSFQVMIERIRAFHVSEPCCFKALECSDWTDFISSSSSPFWLIPLGH